MKHAMTGQLPLLPAIKGIMDEVLAPPSMSGMNGHSAGPLSAERQMLAAARKLSLFAAGVASQKYPTDLAEQQEIMGALADCIMEVYALESCIVRAEKILQTAGETGGRNAVALTRYYAAKAMQTIEVSSRKVIAATAEGDTLRTQMAIVRRLAKYDPADTVGLSREIARHVLKAGRYTV